MKRNPDCFIILVGTNHLRSDHDLEIIRKNIVEVANSCETDAKKVLISSILPRRDSLNGKGSTILADNFILALNR